MQSPAVSLRRSDNQSMNIFYWVMALIIVGSFLPSVLYFVLYAVTSEVACLNRARAFWNVTRVFSLLGVNILIWGHVVLGLWRIWFR